MEAPMILIAMTCLATLFLLIFGALWHQTLMLARRDHSANLVDKRLTLQLGYSK